jgi:hypothetical protein
MSFYIGSGDTLYYKREDGSLVRFAIRVTPDGLKAFDQLRHEWYDVPDVIPAQGKPDVRMRVEVLDD